MTRRSTQLRKAPSLSKPGGFRDALNQQFCTADSAIFESANIRQAMYSSVLRHRENHSSNCSNWLREVCGLKKSKFTAPLIVRREDTVSYGASLLDEILRLLVDDSADGVRWDKVVRIKRALTHGTYSVSAEDVAGKIIWHLSL